MPTNNTDNLLNIEKEGELNAIVTISGLSDIKEEVSPKDEEEKEEILKERFVSNHIKVASSIQILHNIRHFPTHFLTWKILDTFK